MYAENSRMQFVYSVYGMSGEFIGLRDFQGNELTVKEWTEYGPFSDPHDNTVERLSKFKTEREIFLSEKIEGKIKGPVPIFASGKPSHCKSR
jgi:hypothetical protein